MAQEQMNRDDEFTLTEYKAKCLIGLNVISRKQAGSVWVADMPICAIMGFGVIRYKPDDRRRQMKCPSGTDDCLNLYVNQSLRWSAVKNTQIWGR